MSTPELIKELLPYSDKANGKKIKEIKGWHILFKGKKRIDPDCTMELWLGGQCYIIPFRLSIYSIIKAVKQMKQKHDLIMIDYRLAHKSWAIVVCKRNKK